MNAYPSHLSQAGVDVDLDLYLDLDVPVQRTFLRAS